jgi:hypothetical protein
VIARPPLVASRVLKRPREEVFGRVVRKVEKSLFLKAKKAASKRTCESALVRTRPIT